MADLTLLSSTIPIPPHPSFNRQPYSLARASSSRVNLTSAQPKQRPQLSQIHVSDRDKAKRLSGSDPSNDEDSDDTATLTDSPTSYVEPLPIVSPTPIVGTRPTHKPTRSQSAPPERTQFQADHSRRTHTGPTNGKYAASARDTTEFPRSLHSGLNRRQSNLNSPSSVWGSSTCDLLKPPPPLHRPTTFWRHTPRSGVTSSSFSPSTHLIRRSTFIAAGLAFDKPMYDVSALGVESRIVHDAIAAKVTETFWEVIEAR